MATNVPDSTPRIGREIPLILALGRSNEWRGTSANLGNRRTKGPEELVTLWPVYRCSLASSDSPSADLVSCYPYFAGLALTMVLSVFSCPSRCILPPIRSNQRHSRKRRFLCMKANNPTPTISTPLHQFTHNLHISDSSAPWVIQFVQ